MSYTTSMAHTGHHHHRPHYRHSASSPPALAPHSNNTFHHHHYQKPVLQVPVPTQKTATRQHPSSVSMPSHIVSPTSSSSSSSDCSSEQSPCTSSSSSSADSDDLRSTLLQVIHENGAGACHTSTSNSSSSSSSIATTRRNRSSGGESDTSLPSRGQVDSPATSVSTGSRVQSPVKADHPHPSRQPSQQRPSFAGMHNSADPFLTAAGALATRSASSPMLGRKMGRRHSEGGMQTPDLPRDGAVDSQRRGQGSEDGMRPARRKVHRPATAGQSDAGQYKSQDSELQDGESQAGGARRKEQEVSDRTHPREDSNRPPRPNNLQHTDSYFPSPSSSSSQSSRPVQSTPPHLDITSFPTPTLLHLLAQLLSTIVHQNDASESEAPVTPPAHQKHATQDQHDAREPVTPAAPFSSPAMSHASHQASASASTSHYAESGYPFPSASDTFSPSPSTSTQASGPRKNFATPDKNASSTQEAAVSQYASVHERPTILTSAAAALAAPNATLCFHARNIPSISIEAYLVRISKYCPTTNEVFISLLVYFDRMCRLPNLSSSNARTASTMPILSDEPSSSSSKTINDASNDTRSETTNTQFAVDSFNIHRLIISGITVASKFFSDVFYTNSRYAKVGGLPLPELNALELQFLLLNGFDLVVPAEEIQQYADYLLLGCLPPQTPSAPSLVPASTAHPISRASTSQTPSSQSYKPTPAHLSHHRQQSSLDMGPTTQHQAMKKLVSSRSASESSTSASEASSTIVPSEASSVGTERAGEDSNLEEDDDEVEEKDAEDDEDDESPMPLASQSRRTSCSLHDPFTAPHPPAARAHAHAPSPHQHTPSADDRAPQSGGTTSEAIGGARSAGRGRSAGASSGTHSKSKRENSRTREWTRRQAESLQAERGASPDEGEGMQE